jgi:hypothetical protein
MERCETVAPRIRYSTFVRRLLIIATLLGASSIAAQSPGGIILAGEPIRRDDHGVIRFSERQIRNTSEATRAGFTRWLATSPGHELFRYFNTPEYRVIVTEDLSEPGIGRAPEPGILTFLAAADHAKQKEYTLILNPTPWQVPAGWKPMPHEPSSTADFMAAAWAGEMLHIYLYSQGVMLPHHQRDDFQSSWGRMAVELGFPAMTHGESEDADEDWRCGDRCPQRSRGAQRRLAPP